MAIEIPPLSSMNKKDAEDLASRLETRLKKYTKKELIESVIYYKIDSLDSRMCFREIQ